MANDSNENRPNKKWDGFVAQLTAMRGPGDSLQVYENWAASYESDLLEQYGYSAPDIAVAALKKVTSTGARIIDFGCGTGLVGQALAKVGFEAIDGMDISPNMLKHARAKGVYSELIEADLTQTIAVDDFTYDAAIAVGCFGSGHLGPEHFVTLIRCVKAGGAIVMFTNAQPYLEDNYAQHFSELEQQGWIKVHQALEVNYMDKRDRPGWLIVAERR